MIPLNAAPSSDGDTNGVIRLSKEIPDLESGELSSNNNDYRFAFNDSTSWQLCTGNYTNAYFTFKFQKRYLLMTNYTITVNQEWNVYANYPKSWTIDGMFKGRWIKLGFVEDSKLKSDKKHTFPVSCIIPISAVRFTLVGTSTTGHYHLCFHKLDFFGSFISRSTFYLICNTRNQHTTNHLFLISVFILFHNYFYLFFCFL